MGEKNKSFIKGALILSLSGFLVKIIGVLFRIPLTNLVGSAAMSYYSSAYSVYVLLLSLSTSGIPIGISVLVSKFYALGKNNAIQKTVKTAFFIFVPVGFFLSVTGMIFSGKIAVIMNSAEAWYSVFFIMPAIFFISVVSVFRGYFQGLGNMLPTAVSNIIEAISKLVFGYGISYFLFLRGYPKKIIVGGAVFGVMFGTFLSAVFMTAVFFIKKNRTDKTGEKTSEKGILKNLVIITFPLMISSVTSNLMGTIDAFLVMSRMKTYLAAESAKLCWGAYANMAQTVFNLPSFLIVSLGTSLVPSISSAYALKNGRELKNTVEKAFRYTSVIAFFSAFFLYVFAENILKILFSGDPAGVYVAVPLLKTLSFSLISVGFTNITASVLHSLGKSYLSVFSVAVGASVKTAATYFLVGNADVNIMGAPLATNIAYPVMLILNIFFIVKNLKFLPPFFKNVFIPCSAAFVSVGISKILYPQFSDNLSSFSVFLILSVLSFIVYILLLSLVGIVNVCEILRNFCKSKKSP